MKPKTEQKTKDLKIFMNYRRLKEIKRQNNFPIIHKVDVAQHSYYVAMMAMIMADEYNTWVEEQNAIAYDELSDNVYLLVKTEIVIRKAMLHDLEESFTSDIPWNIKHASTEFNKAINEVIDQKVRNAHKGCYTMDMYREICSKCKDGLEGRFVEFADTLELGLHCWEEMASGNRFLKPMLEKCLNLIESYQDYAILREASPFFDSLCELLHSRTEVAEELIDIC